MHDTFQKALRANRYPGIFTGITPLKTNPRKGALEAVLSTPGIENHGLEVGSVPELLIAMSKLPAGKSPIICNGVKSPEFLKLCQIAAAGNHNIVVCIESMREVETLIQEGHLAGKIKLGIRMQLNSESSGSWKATAGQKGGFGLSLPEIHQAVSALRAANKLGKLRMLHFHQGSQIPSLDHIGEAVREAMAVYVSLHQEGAWKLSMLNVGGGLGIPYGWSSEKQPNIAYTLQKYAQRVVKQAITSAQKADIPVPTLLCESGRAMLAPYSAEFFSVVPKSDPIQPPPPVEHRHPAEILIQTFDKHMNAVNADTLHMQAYSVIKKLREEWKHSPHEMPFSAVCRAEALFEALQSKTERLMGSSNQHTMLQGNLSTFQSIPDYWGLDFLFPMMPIQRLHERPTEAATIKDLTCDSDGIITSFAGPGGTRKSLPVHRIAKGETYYIGTFLTGAYQEVLGSIHNLMGRPISAEVILDQKGDVQFRNISAPDRNEDMIHRCGFKLDELKNNLSYFAETNGLSVDDRQHLLDSLDRTPY